MNVEGTAEYVNSNELNGPTNLLVPPYQIEKNAPFFLATFSFILVFT